MLRKTLALTVAVATLALALTGCAPSNSPTDVVRGYLDALADGDGEQALKLQPVVAEYASSPLLTAEVFAGSVERISNVKVDAATESNGDSADVPFSYELAGETHSGTARLAKAEDGTWSFLPQSEGNELDVSSLNFPSQDVVESFTVSGAEFDPAELPEGNVKVFPGVYDITVAIDPRFTMTQPEPVAAPVGSTASAVGAGGGLPGLEPTAQTFDDAVATANAKVEACAAQNTTMPDGNCPFARVTLTDGQEGTWQNVPTITAQDCTFNDKVVGLECAFYGSGITFQVAPGPGIIPGREPVYTSDEFRLKDVVWVGLVNN